MQQTFTGEAIDEWSKPFYWEALCKELDIGKIELDTGGEHCPNRCQSTPDPQLRLQGFSQVEAGRVDPLLLSEVCDGIRALNEAGFPATFILLFDAAWKIASYAKTTLTNATSVQHEFQYDALAWCVTGAGFSPHRDRQPEDAADSFDSDGNPSLVTHWIALTDATPATSCLYVIPKPYDPGYIAGDIAEEHPLQRALSQPSNYQHIRAIPRAAGESVIFTHRIIHWGSARDPATKLPPRMALSFTAALPTYEAPYLLPSTPFPPPFAARLFLVCSQMICYYQRFDLPPTCLEACYTYCCQHHEGVAVPKYWQRVQREYCKARHETKPADSDAEEALMDAMLDEPDEFGDDFEEQQLEEEQTSGGGSGLEEEDEDDVGDTLFSNDCEDDTAEPSDRADSGGASNAKRQRRS